MPPPHLGDVQTHQPCVLLDPVQQRGQPQLGQSHAGQQLQWEHEQGLVSTLSCCHVPLHVAGDQSAEHDFALTRSLCTERQSVRASGITQQTREILLGCRFVDLAKHLFRQGATGPHPLHDRISHAIDSEIDGSGHGSVALLRLCMPYVCVVSPDCCQHD